jgi:LPS export ABC transporter protein LptC
MVQFLLSCVILFVSCGQPEAKPTIEDPETTPTQISHDHRIINSKDGQRQYRMETPLLERYELATEPFMEFTQGIKVELFGDSLEVESDIRADYAHFNETTELWTARGHVVSNNYAGDRQLLTERLYWDQKTKKIYSDTVAMVIDGGNRHVGTNFEADESFETWTFHNTTGQIEVDASQMSADSTATATATVVPTDTITNTP